MPVPRRFDRRPPERDQTRINDRIRVPEVRLIDETGKQVGVVKTADAVRYAEQHDLDLVEVAPDARPPVCRVLDYSKYKYEQAQKLKAARKHQTQITIREIKFRPKIASADYETKKGHVEKFLRGKDKVKVTIMFRGREQAHPERGTALLQRLAEELTDVAVVEQVPLQDGRNMTMMLGPSKAVLASEDEPRGAHGAKGEQIEATRQGKTSRRNRAAAEAAGLPVPTKAPGGAQGAGAGIAEVSGSVDAPATGVDEGTPVTVEPDQAPAATEPDQTPGATEPDHAPATSEPDDTPDTVVSDEAPTKPKRPTATAKPAAAKPTAAKSSTTKSAAAKSTTAAKRAATKGDAAAPSVDDEAPAAADGATPALRTRRRSPTAAAKSEG